MYSWHFCIFLKIQDRYVGNQAGSFIPSTLIVALCLYLDLHVICVNLMYLEITLVMSALISSIISGEQFTLSDINRIFNRSFATWQELFLRKKCFIFIRPLPILFEKYRLLLSRKTYLFRSPGREFLFLADVPPHCNMLFPPVYHSLQAVLPDSWRSPRFHHPE